MKYCLMFWHDWKRYSEEITEQLFTGGYMAWFQCQKCLKIKFDWCDKYSQVEVEYKIPSRDTRKEESE